MADSQAGGGGVAKVPIGGDVNSAGTTTYNGVQCNQYTMGISSADARAHDGISLSAPAGVYLSTTSVNVPATGSVNVTVYVPTTMNGTVNVTAYSAGYSSTSLPVQP